MGSPWAGSHELFDGFHRSEGVESAGIERVFVNLYPPLASRPLMSRVGELMNDLGTNTVAQLDTEPSMVLLSLLQRSQNFFDADESRSFKQFDRFFVQELVMLSSERRNALLGSLPFHRVCKLVRRVADISGFAPLTGGLTHVRPLEGIPRCPLQEAFWRAAGKAGAHSGAGRAFSSEQSLCADAGFCGGALFKAESQRRAAGTVSCATIVRLCGAGRFPGASG